MSFAIIKTDLPLEIRKKTFMIYKLQNSEIQETMV